MKASSTSNHTTPRIILIAAIVAVLVAGAASYYVYGLGGNLFGWSSNSSEQDPSDDDSTENQSDTSSDVDENPPTDEQVDAGNNIKDHSGDNNNSGDTTLTITSANSVGTQLKIKTILNKVTDSGTCTLTLSNGSDSHGYDAVGVQALPSYSTCKGFTVDTAGLASGTWKATIVFKDSSSQASISKDIEL